MKGKVLTFYMGGSLFGIDILAVKEINRNIEYTAVPDAPPHVSGLLNMRGQVVTLFNLAGLMGYENSDKGLPSCIILKNSHENPYFVGFFIDKPGSVLDIDEDNCEPAPANMSLAENKFVSEVVKLESGLLMIINYVAIFEQ